MSQVERRRRKHVPRPARAPALPPQTPTQEPSPNEEPFMLWGAKAIGAEIKRTPRQAFYLLEAGLLPAKKVGALWTAERGALRRHLGGGA